MLFVSGMRSDYEFPEIYLDFIRQHGDPSALRLDNENEMCQRSRHINCDLVIAVQWSEPHRQWQQSPELNCG
jgi:hypothetical protein